MCQGLLRDPSLNKGLLRIDVELMAEAQQAGCRFCGRRLNRADYPRKPRGGPPGLDGSHWKRLSLCCAAEGCRLRSTPPSVRFLGRRVFLATVVVLACVFESGLTAKRLAVLRAELGVSRRTVERWRRWWLEDFASSAFYRTARGMFRTPADPAGLREVEVGCLEHPQSGLADFYREMGDLFGVELRPHNRWAGFRVLREKWISHIGNTMMRPVLLVDEAQEVNTAVLNELRILSSTCFDSRSLLGVVLAGDQRLVARLRHQDLAPLKSRIRMQLVLESATPKELEACLLQLVEAAGNQALLTPGLARTIRVKSHPYSVPSRLIGERVRVRVFEEYLEIYLSGDLMARRGRVRGNGAFNVSWRDVIGGLVRKPGAFRRYLYRDAVFPSDLFRRAYERLDTALPTWVADMNYLQVVKLARDTTQHDVERALGALEETQELPHFEAVAALAGMERPTIPEVHVDEVEFATYDELTPDAAKEAKQ